MIGEFFHWIGLSVDAAPVQKVMLQFGGNEPDFVFIHAYH